MKGRDLFDIVCAIQKIPELIDPLAEFTALRKDIIEARLTLNHKQLQTEYNGLQAMYGGPDYETSPIHPVVAKLLFASCEITATAG